MARDKDRLAGGWPSVLDQTLPPPSDGQAETLIDPSLGQQVADAVKEVAQEAGMTTEEDIALPPPGVSDADPTTVTPVVSRAPRPRTSRSSPAKRRPSLPDPPSLPEKAPPTPRPQTSRARPEPDARIPREATHIDIAVALGVGPAPPVESPTVRPDGPPSPSVNAPLLPSKSLPQVLNDLRQESARRRTRQAMKVDSADLARSVATTESVSRVIPAVLMVLLLISSAMVGTLLLSGRPKAQEHVELRFLTLRGQPQAAVPSDTPSRVSIATDPPGILVLHEREILGKTPVNLDLPVQLADRVGIELSSPYFERWVGEVTPDDAGAYRVQVELKRRD